MRKKSSFGVTNGLSPATENGCVGGGGVEFTGRGSVVARLARRPSRRVAQSP